MTALPSPASSRVFTSSRNSGASSVKTPPARPNPIPGNAMRPRPGNFSAGRRPQFQRPHPAIHNAAKMLAHPCIPKAAMAKKAVTKTGRQRGLVGSGSHQIRYLQSVVNVCIIHKKGMSISVKTPILTQRRYYTETASRYDIMHAHEAVDGDDGMQMLFSFLRSLEVHSLLDVGSATGRGLPRLAEGVPNALVCGVEPVEALIRQGICSGVNRDLPLLQASGDALPFADKSFDAVCEFGILHHVPEPARVIEEMLRVARTVVVVSDANRFGQGPLALRTIKLLLYKLKLRSEEH